MEQPAQFKPSPKHCLGAGEEAAGVRGGEGPSSCTISGPILLICTVVQGEVVIMDSFVPRTEVSMRSPSNHKEVSSLSPHCCKKNPL